MKAHSNGNAATSGNLSFSVERGSAMHVVYGIQQKVP
jgi:hypothetical protein